MVSLRPVAQGPKRPADRAGATKAVAAQGVQVGVLERGEPGDVLVQDVGLALVGGQGPELFDGSLLPRDMGHFGHDLRSEVRWTAFAPEPTD